MSRLFASGGQSIGASASSSVLPMNIQGRFPLGLICLISLQSKGLSKVFYSTTVRKHQFFSVQPSLWSNSHIHPCMAPGKTIALIRRTMVCKVMSLLFNMLSRFAIAFLPRSKCLFNFFDAATVCSDFGAQENKICHCFHFFPMYLPWSGRSRCRDLFFFFRFFSFFFFFVCWVLSHLFHSPLSPPSRGSLVSFHFLPLQWYHLVEF